MAGAHLSVRPPATLNEAAPITMRVGRGDGSELRAGWPKQPRIFPVKTDDSDSESDASTPPKRKTLRTTEPSPPPPSTAGAINKKERRGRESAEAKAARLANVWCSRCHELGLYVNKCPLQRKQQRKNEKRTVKEQRHLLPRWKSLAVVVRASLRSSVSEGQDHGELGEQRAVMWT